MRDADNGKNAGGLRPEESPSRRAHSDWPLPEDIAEACGKALYDLVMLRLERKIAKKAFTRPEEPHGFCHYETDVKIRAVLRDLSEELPAIRDDDAPAACLIRSDHLVLDLRDPDDRTLICYDIAHAEAVVKKAVWMLGDRDVDAVEWRELNDRRLFHIHARMICEADGTPW